MIGLGFNNYTATYLARVKEAGGTTANLLQKYAIEALTRNCFYTLSLNRKKPIAVWPFFGGNAGSHAINLFGNDLITWTGTVTHSSNGILGDSATGRGGTGVKPSVRLTSLTRLAFGLYTRSASSSNTVDLANEGSGYFRLNPRTVAGSAIAYFGGGLLSVSAAVATSAGLTHFAKYAATENFLYKNGTLIASSASSWAGVSNLSIVLLADALSGFSGRNIAFAFFADTVSDATLLYAAVQTYQTRLGRQV